jgi:hypothetical protein
MRYLSIVAILATSLTPNTACLSCDACKKTPPQERGRLSVDCCRFLFTAPFHSQSNQADAEEAQCRRFRHRHRHRPGAGARRVTVKIKNALTIPTLGSARIGSGGREINRLSLRCSRAKGEYAECQNDTNAFQVTSTPALGLRIVRGRMIGSKTHARKRNRLIHNDQV